MFYGPIRDFSVLLYTFRSALNYDWPPKFLVAKEKKSRNFFKCHLPVRFEHRIFPLKTRVDFTHFLYWVFFSDPRTSKQIILPRRAEWTERENFTTKTFVAKKRHHDEVLGSEKKTQYKKWVKSTRVFKGKIRCFKPKNILEGVGGGRESFCLIRALVFLRYQAIIITRENTGGARKWDPARHHRTVLAAP